MREIDSPAYFIGAADTDWAARLSARVSVATEATQGPAVTALDNEVIIEPAWRPELPR